MCLQSLLRYDAWHILGFPNISWLVHWQQYIEKAASDENFCNKNWKLHLPLHLFDDIETKGVTRNYNTKPNEKLHGPLKNAYKDWTNFKNVAPQVPLIDIVIPAMSFWHHCIDFRGQPSVFGCPSHPWQLNKFNGLKDNSELPPDIEDAMQKITLGSKQKPTSFRTLEEGCRRDATWCIGTILNSVGRFFQSPTRQTCSYWSKWAGDFMDLLSCHCIVTNTLLAYRVSVPQSQLWVSCWLASWTRIIYDAVPVSTTKNAGTSWFSIWMTRICCLHSSSMFLNTKPVVTKYGPSLSFIRMMQRYPDKKYHGRIAILVLFGCALLGARKLGLYLWILSSEELFSLQDISAITSGYTLINMYLFQFDYKKGQKTGFHIK